MPKKKKQSNLPYTRIKRGKLYVVIPYRVGAAWKQKARLAENQEDALRIMHELRAELGQHGPGVFAAERMTFSELLAEYRRAHPKTLAWYWEPMEEFFGARKIRSITYADLKQFRAQRAAAPKRFSPETTRKPATVNRELEHLRAVLLYALRHGWIRANPFAAGPPLIQKSEEDRRSRLPTPEEEESILAACVWPRDHVGSLIIATRDTGLRRGALLSLRFSMVDWERGLLAVPAGNRHKRRPQVIGLTARLLAEIRRLWEESEKDPERKIFGWWQVEKNGEGNEIRTWHPVTDFRGAYECALRLAGVTDLRFTDWRHAFATDLAEADVPRQLAMKISGHTQESTHDIYLNVDARLARSAASALDRLHASRTTRSSAGSEPGEPATGFVN